MHTASNLIIPRGADYFDTALYRWEHKQRQYDRAKSIQKINVNIFVVSCHDTVARGQSVPSIEHKQDDFSTIKGQSNKVDAFY